MKRSWVWILVILAGALTAGGALQYYFAGEPYRNSSARNWAVVGQALFGFLVICFGLYKQFKAARQAPEPDESEGIKLNDD